MIMGGFMLICVWNILLFYFMHSTMSSEYRIEKITFADRIRSFPLETLLSEEKNEQQWIKFFSLVFKSIIQEPFVPIHPKCNIPELPVHPDCTAPVDNLFTGAIRAVPAKIGHAIQFGFDVDVLEIHLNEIYDVVDVFFICEWTLLHNIGILKKKPLTWDRIQHQDRFLKFRDKIVHLILDDIDTAHVQQVKRDDIFQFEKFQERRRWEKIHEWNNLTEFFTNPDDLIGFGDADEIASRTNIHRLKHCQLVSTVETIDIGIWFPFGQLNRAFRSDYPVNYDLPHTLGDPTYWTYQAASALNSDVPSRRRGASQVYLLGGIHMTHYRYLPYLLMKQMTCTECASDSFALQHVIQQLENGELVQAESDLHQIRGDLIDFIDPLTHVYDKSMVYYPWFYECNVERYPTWASTDRMDDRVI